eukprot:ANDGO_02685.mRNA.1 hypothetical protein
MVSSTGLYSNWISGDLFMVILAHGSCSIALLLLNKHLSEASSQCVSLIILMQNLIAAFLQPSFLLQIRKSFSLASTFKILVSAVGIVCCLYMNMLSLAESSIPLVTLFRFATPSISLFFESVISQKFPNRGKIFYTIIIFTGGMIVVASEIHDFFGVGTLYCLLNTVANSLLGIWENRMMKSERHSGSAELIGYFRNLLSMPFLLLLAIQCSDVRIYMTFASLTPVSWFILLLTGILAFSYTGITFRVHEKTTPTFLTAANCLYKVLSALIGALLWNGFSSWSSWIGFMISAFGAFKFLAVDTAK